MKARILLLTMSLAALAMGAEFIGQGYYQAMPGPNTFPK